MKNSSQTISFKIFRLTSASWPLREGWLGISRGWLWVIQFGPHSNSAKNSFVNYIWSRLVFPLGAIVLPLSKLFIGAPCPEGELLGVRLLCIHICMLYTPLPCKYEHKCLKVWTTIACTYTGQYYSLIVGTFCVIHNSSCTSIKFTFW